MFNILKCGIVVGMALLALILVANRGEAQVAPATVDSTELKCA